MVVSYRFDFQKLCDQFSGERVKWSRLCIVEVANVFNSKRFIVVSQCCYALDATLSGIINLTQGRKLRDVIVKGSGHDLTEINCFQTKNSMKNLSGILY